MGYNIYYEGTIELDKPLDDKTYHIVTNLNATRRMIWDAEALEREGYAYIKDIGHQGEFFFAEAMLGKKEFRFLEDTFVIHKNVPPGGQPDINGVWTVSEDREHLIWNQKEKSYYGHEWLKYLVKKVLIPRGYQPKGIVNWFAEYDKPPRKFHTLVEGDRVVKKKGYDKTVKEPDINGWYDREIQLYKESQQQWFDKLTKEKVQFLHKNDFTQALSFNLFSNGDIVQTVLKNGELDSCRYLYRNVKKEDDKWVYEEDYENMVLDPRIQQQLKKQLDTYMKETLDFLDTGIM